MRNPIPIVILAGSDRRAASLPDAARDGHPLSGYKGVEIRLDGRPLVEMIVERLRGSGAFDPIYLVGPAQAYGGVAHDVRLIDANGTFGENIQLSMNQVAGAHPACPVAFTVCDIVPEVDALCRVMADYESHGPCDLWFPMIRAPQDRRRLGASHWKPAYRIIPAPGEEPVAVLPGHLAVVEPAALRLDFVCRLIQLGYRTRNRSIGYRRGVMVRGLVLELIHEDLLHVLRLQAPTTTWSVLSAGIGAARGLMAGRITRARLERAVDKIFISRRHRRRYPDRAASLPIVDALSLALDIDTEEEAVERGGDVRSRLA